jgi:hypothetical protein
VDKEILWAGVSFDPTDDSDYANDQHDTIVGTLLGDNHWRSTEPFPSGAQLDSYASPAGDVVDIFDAVHTRIGFGVRVNSIAEGNAKLNEVTAWLRSLGITLHVSVWAWSPAGVPSSIARPAGVDGMVSLDLE